MATQCPSLPRELRDMIWELVDGPPRVLHFRTVEKWSCNKIFWLASPVKPPDFLGICRESREVGLKQYTTPAAPLQHLYVNYAKGTLHHDRIDVRGLGPPLGSPTMSRQNISDVTNVVLFYDSKTCL